MLGEVHEAMTNVDEGDEHQMERRFNGRRRLEKVHCDAKRKHEATLPELAKHWRISRSSWDRSGGLYTGETEVSDFFDVELRVNTLQFLLETVLVRRGRRWWYMATPNRHIISLVQFTTWRSELVIAKVIMTARTRRMRVKRSRWRSKSYIWALGGHNWAPGGRIWKPIYGVRPRISLGPADGDLLTEPTFSQGGVYTPTIQKECEQLLKNKNYNYN